MIDFFRPELPEDTVYHIGVSGGKDSTAVLLWMIHESGVPRDRLDVTFCDTENEHEWTYEHIRLLSETVHPIRTLKPERGFIDLALHKRRFPGTKTRFCTQFLKIVPTQDHITRLLREHGKVVAVSGTRAAEASPGTKHDRAKALEWDYSGHLLTIQWRPLLRWTLDDVLAIHRKHGVPLNPLYEAGALRVGCWPCIMSRKAEIRNIALNFPERIDQIRAAEQEFVRRYGRYSSFFPSKTVPPRFRSMPYRCKDGRVEMIATIDDVVRWSLTGDRAKGSWDDQEEEAEEPVSCSSGFCE